MGIFQKVSGWLTDKSDRFIRGDAGHEGGYYATREARQAYGGMSDEQELAQSAEAGEQTDRKPALDPFGRGEGDYGGRVPYRSKYDLEMEAYQQAQQQQAAMQQSGRRPAVHPQESQPMAAPQQPAAQPAPPQGYAPQAASNVVPFPGMQRGPDGMVYAHVEYIVLLRSRNECKDVIGYIKTSASVFLNMEFIASDSERQRCVDMLSGAAYTLGCALNKISPRGIYLISAPTVKVVLDPAIQKFSAAPEMQGYAPQRYQREGYQSYAAAPGYPQQPAQAGGYAPQAEPATGYPQQSEPPQGYNQPMPQRSAFSQESPTARFQAQGTQRMPQMSLGSVMTGAANTGRYAAVGYRQ